MERIISEIKRTERVLNNFKYIPIRPPRIGLDRPGTKLYKKIIIFPIDTGDRKMNLGEFFD